MKKTVTLTFSDGSPSIELPIEQGIYGKPVIDIRGLGAHGYFTHDPGFTATSSCTSAITYIDGDEGLLYYRGYPIEELAYKSDHMEVCYLLLHGELPTADQKQAFEQSIRHHTLLHDQMENVFRGFRRSAHPMAVMIGVTGAMSAFDSSWSVTCKAAVGSVLIRLTLPGQPADSSFCCSRRRVRTRRALQSLAQLSQALIDDLEQVIDLFGIDAQRRSDADDVAAQAAFAQQNAAVLAAVH